MSIIKFGCWAPDEATFWAAWEAAGIGQFVTDEDGTRWEYNAAYRGIETTTSWHGQVVDVPGTYDADGNEITPPTMIDGWHTNVKVTGPLADQFTAGLEQYDEDGNLKSLWDRTHADTVFQLQVRPKQAKFPGGRIKNKVHYANIADFSSPANVF